MARWLKAHGATPEQPAITGLGISLDEIHRARTTSGIPHQRLAYPLLELGLRRSDCIQVIRRAGLPVPPRSACWFCPFHRPTEWGRMRREEPALFERACQLEGLLNQRRRQLGRDPVYLTRYGRPLAQVIPDQQALPLFEPDPGSATDSADLEVCESGYCMT